MVHHHQKERNQFSTKTLLSNKQTNINVRSYMVRHGGTWALDLSVAGLSPSGFLDFFFLCLGTPMPVLPTVVCISATVLIGHKGADSPGSHGSRMGAIGALVYVFPSQSR